ncbi:hypothetical protein BDV12DRAFT_197422 [Aspergillus spectabilis]
MSSRSTDYPRKPSTSTRGRSTHTERDLIDRRLKRLREEVLPFYPFLLTVPTDVPFRLGNRFVNNWAVSDDGPFTPEEQQLQYMTFLTHNDSDSLLVAVGDWSDATASVMADSRSRPQSAISMPSSGSIKKKISLHDYKHKRTNGTSPSPLGQGASGHQSASTLHVPYDNHTSKHITTSDSHEKPPKKSHSPNPSAQSDFEHVDRKRPPERDHDRYGPPIKDGAPAKRRRLSPEPTATQPKAELSNGSGLPELLSPTLPPTSSTPRLPRLLSPTLPPELERELAKLSNESLASDSQPESTVNSDTAKPKTQKDKLSKRDAFGTPNFPGKLPLLGLEKSASRGAETVKYSLQVTPKASPQAQTGSSRPLQASSTKPVQPSLSRPRLLVKLKYGRSNRKRIEALLKFSGKKKPNHQNSPTPDAVERESTHITKAEQQRVSASDQVNTKATRVDGKTKLVASSQANSSTEDRPKESRLVGSDKPQTPVLSQTQQERTRPVSITPAKDLKHSSSRHDLTNNDGKGHHHPVARKAPAESALGATTQSPSRPSSTDRNGERRAWKEEYQKYGNLGRELKHAADRHTAKDKVTSTDEKLAAATAIEAIICFVLAFIAEDQSKAISRQIGDSSTWLSIIAYWRVVKKNSLSHPPLHSLCLILGAVSYDAIHALDLERLAITPIPGEHTPVPTPASDGYSVHLDESKKTLKDFLELKNRLPECYKESQRLWFDGSRGLSEDILAREFPETWSKRARNYTEQGKKRLKPGEYSGEIYLPLGKTSTPLEIIRFSCALLREWCSKENIDWRGKLDL